MDKEIKRIGEIIKAKPTTKPKKGGERHQIVGEIFEKLNETSYKKVSYPYLGELLRGYKTDLLYDLNSRCKQSKNFAACFWYFTKPK